MAAASKSWRAIADLLGVLRKQRDHRGHSGRSGDGQIAGFKHLVVLATLLQHRPDHGPYIASAAT